jgi:hypothetical protein
VKGGSLNPGGLKTAALHVPCLNDPHKQSLRYACMTGINPVIKGCTLMTGPLLVIEVQTLMTNIEPVIQETPNGRFNTSPQGLYLNDQ